MSTKLGSFRTALVRGRKENQTQPEVPVAMVGLRSDARYCAKLARPADLEARQSDTGAWIRSIGGCSPEPNA